MLKKFMSYWALSHVQLTSLAKLDKEYIMARICTVCGKHPRVVNRVSHAKNRVKQWVYPNVHRIRFSFEKDSSGKVHAGNVCTQCVRSEKITKVV